MIETRPECCVLLACDDRECECDGGPCLFKREFQVPFVNGSLTVYIPLDATTVPDPGEQR